MVTRRLIVVAIALGVGALHLVTGERYAGPAPAFVNGYLIDILLPTAMFLVLGVGRWRLAQQPPRRAAAVLAVGAISETLQLFRVPVFGRTFDPWDYVMFTIGAGLGLLVERQLLDRIRPAQ